MDSLPEYIEGTGCNSYRKVVRLPTFKNFSSKYLEQTPERRVGAQSLLFTNLIHFLFNSGFFKGKRNTGNFSEITLILYWHFLYPVLQQATTHVFTIIMPKQLLKVPKTKQTLFA